MKTYKVATVCMQNSNFAQNLLEGFKSVLKEKDPILSTSIDSYYADNKLDMIAVANEIVDKEYDLIYSIGAMFSKTMQTITDKRKSKTPVVFVGVVQPARLEIVASEERPGGHITGITFDDYAKHLLPTFAKLIKPNMKSVLIPWDEIGNGGLLERDVKVLADSLRQQGVTVKAVPVKTRSEVLERANSLIDSVDTVIVPEGSVLVTEATQGLIKLCEQSNVTLIANDLDAARQGAAVGWGTSPRDIALACFDFVDDILLKSRSPGSLPVNRMRNCYRVAINAKAAQHQDLHLSPAQVFLFNSSSLITT